MRLFLLLLLAAVATAAPLPDLSACKPYALSVPGPVDFVATGDLGAFPLARLGPYTVSTLYTGGKVAFTGNAVNDFNPGFPNLARGITGNKGDFAAGSALEQPSAACVNATNAMAAAIDALSCDHIIQDGVLSNITEVLVEGVYTQAVVPLTLTLPGVYCSSSQEAAGFSLVNVNLTIIANGSLPFIFRGLWQQWSGDTTSFTDPGAITAINLQGGITADQVFVRTPAPAVIDPETSFSVVYPSWHAVGNAAGPLLAIAPVTFISSAPMVIAGNPQVGRILFTSGMVPDASDAYLAFTGTSDVLITADTRPAQFLFSSSTAGGLATDASTPASGSFVLNSTATVAITTLAQPVSVGIDGGTGTLTVFISPLATQRTIPALLEGRALKSGVISFHFEGQLTSATIVIDASLMTVAPGKVLAFFRFNEVTGVWDRRGGTLDPVTHLLSVTTTAFSDWSVQEADPGPEYNAHDTVPDATIAVTIAMLVGVIALISFTLCAWGKHKGQR